MSSLVVGRQRRGKLELSTIVDPSTIVGPEQIYPLGYEVVVPAGSTNGNGPQTWVYVMSDNIPAFHVVSALGALFEVSDGGPADQINTPIGATQSAIPANHFGFVLRKGVGTLTAATGISIGYNESVIMAGGGEVTTHAGPSLLATETGFGFAVTSVTGAGAPIEFTAYVNCAG